MGAAIGHKRRAVAAVIGAVLLVGACGGDVGSTAASLTPGFPLTVESCGQQVPFDRPPERVVLIGDNTVPLLAAADALDRVVALAGEPPLAIYDDATRAAVERIPLFGFENSGGSVEVSLEEVIARQPDLVIGQGARGSDVTPAALAEVGIPNILQPSACTDNASRLRNPDFEDVYRQVELYGRLFDNNEEAAAAVAGLRERVAAVERPMQGATQRTAAALFIFLGDSRIGAYGSDSVAAAQLRTLMLTNVFGDVAERYFDSNTEEIIGRDPDVLVLLHVEDDPQAIKDQFLAIPGVDRMKAVRNDQLLPLRFEFTDPPTPLSVEGLERIAEAFVPGAP